MDVQKIYNRFDRYYNSHKYINETSWHVLKYIRVKKVLELKSKKNILIPIEKFSCKILQSHEFRESIETIIDNEFYLNELKKYLIKYFTFYKFSSDQVIYSFILTVYTLLKKYNLKKVFILIDPLAKVLERTKTIEFPSYDIKMCFTKLAAFIVENFYHNKKLDSENRLYFILFCKVIFYPYRSSTEFKRILKIIGMDSYKRFLNEIYLYVKNEDFSEDMYELFKHFIIHYKSDLINESDEMDECLLYFARKGFVCPYVPDKLGSKYVDEYTSLILMKELKNEHTRNL